MSDSGAQDTFQTDPVVHTWKERLEGVTRSSYLRPILRYGLSLFEKGVADSLISTGATQASREDLRAQVAALPALAVDDWQRELFEEAMDAMFDKFASDGTIPTCSRDGPIPPGRGEGAGETTLHALFPTSYTYMLVLS